MEGGQIRRKLTTLMVVRLIISSLLLGAAVLARGPATEAWQADALYLLIGWTFALSAADAATLRLAERRRWLVELQLALDTLTVSAFVWVTGGIASYLLSLYFLPIIGASALQSRRGAVLVAALGAVLYIGLVAVQYEQSSWALPFWPAGPAVAIPSVRVAQYTVVINVLGFFAVAVLSGSLAEGLRRADVKLADASTTIADLQAFNQHIIDSLTMGLVTTDLAGRVLTFNQAAETIIGQQAHTARGRDVADLLQVPPAFADGMSVGFKDGRETRADYKLVRPDGPAIDVGLSATPLVTATGQSGFLFTFQDVTAIRKFEREARVQQRLAAVGEMAAGIAHEIRNPLASMSGSIQVLRKELSLNEEQAQLMDIVLRESERLNQTIRSFLAYARPQRFSIGRLDLRPVVQDAALLLRNSAEVGEHHEIEVSAPDTPVWCEADEGQIRQIIWNLATNGLRAMPDGGRLLLAAQQEAGQQGAILLVKDEGIGIGDADLDAMFQPFQGSFPKGSGLGMAIVHRIVSDYGGEIRVTSKPGAGTTVEVRLPGHDAAAA